MKLFEDPRYDPIRITILIVLICVSGFFIYTFAFKREANKAQVYPQNIQDESYKYEYDFPSEAGSTTADESLIVPDIVVTPAPTKSIVKKKTPNKTPSNQDINTTTTTGTLDIGGTNTGGTGTDNITTTGTGGDVTSGNTSGTTSGGVDTTSTTTTGGGSGTTVVDPTTTSGSDGGYTSGGA